jgi:hypothetical protein
MLESGMIGKWKPGARHYAHFVDLRAYAVVEIEGLDVHEIQVPWEAMALVPKPPAEFDDPLLAAHFAQLQGEPHRHALAQLIREMEDAIDELRSASLLARETPAGEITPVHSWSGRFSEPPIDIDNDSDALRNWLTELQWLEICVDTPLAESFPALLDMLDCMARPAFPSSLKASLEPLWYTWFQLYRA